jgi:hypothetical protein
MKGQAEQSQQGACQGLQAKGGGKDEDGAEDEHCDAAVGADAGCVETDRGGSDRAVGDVWAISQTFLIPQISQIRYTLLIGFVLQPLWSGLAGENAYETLCSLTQKR